MNKQEMYQAGIEQMESFINKYGADQAIFGFIEALKNVADEMSDMGLKERAIETIELAELLRNTVLKAEGLI